MELKTGLVATGEGVEMEHKTGLVATGEGAKMELKTGLVATGEGAKMELKTGLVATGEGAEMERKTGEICKREHVKFSAEPRMTNLPKMEALLLSDRYLQLADNMLSSKSVYGSMLCLKPKMYTGMKFTPPSTKAAQQYLAEKIDAATEMDELPLNLKATMLGLYGMCGNHGTSFTPIPRHPASTAEEDAYIAAELEAAKVMLERAIKK